MHRPTFTFRDDVAAAMTFKGRNLRITSPALLAAEAALQAASEEAAKPFPQRSAHERIAICAPAKVALDDEIARLRTPVEAFLAEVNGRAKDYTIAAWQQLRDLAGDAENWMDLREVRARHRHGNRLWYRSGGRTPHKRYPKPVNVTEIVLHRTTTGWILVDAMRTCSWKARPEASMYLTEATRQDAIDFALHGKL